MADSIFIASPYARGFEGGCTATIANTIRDLSSHGIGCDFLGLSAAIIDDLRDLFCYKFLATKHSHMLCIDSDISAPGSLARTLHGFGLPFIGGIYARRKFDLQKVIAAAKAGKPSPEAHGYGFAYRPLDGTVNIDANGLCEVATIGFGFALLRRDCLERMIEVSPRYKSNMANDTVSGFFRMIRTDEIGSHEDYSFCHRWREVGGKVMAYARADIKHTGTFHYGVPFSVAAKVGAL